MTDQREPWHLDRRVPIALILTILAQTASVAWFFASLEGRVDVLERYEVDSGRRVERNADAINILQSRSAAQDEKLEAILRTVERIDRRVNMVSPP